MSQKGKRGLTKSEFIDLYMDASKLEADYRTPLGFHVPGSAPRIAMPCECGDPSCKGWKMAHDDDDREVDAYKAAMG